jgi:glycosyltransferase involved in cell wall biosynthesis
MLDILLSTMHGVRPSWVSRAPPGVGLIIVDQCDREAIAHDAHGNRLIETTERGLSKSRNMGLANSRAKYCMFCDNDVELDFAAVERIRAELNRGKLGAEALVTSHPEHGFLASRKARTLGWRSISRVASWQVIVDRDFLRRRGIRLDERFGLGAKIDHGEENILLADILRRGGRVVLIPQQVVRHADQGTGYRFGRGTLVKKYAIYRRMYGRLFVFPYLAFCAKNLHRLLQRKERS